MKYELNKTYIVSRACSFGFLHFRINEPISFFRIESHFKSHGMAYWTIKGKSSFCLSHNDVSALKLIAEEFSFLTHVLKYAPQDMDENDYPEWTRKKFIEECNEMTRVLCSCSDAPDIVDRIHLIEEMGDVFYFFTAICEAYDITLDEIKESNIKKLQKRFQKGYWNQEEADLKRDHND